MEWIVSFAVAIILGLMPLFFQLGATLKDLRDTRKKIKQNQKEIQEMIYGNQERES